MFGFSKTLATDFKRFIAAGAGNTLATFLLYQVLLIWLDARLAYAVSWTVGIALVAIFYPAVFRVPNAGLTKRIGIVLVYLTSFLLGLSIIAIGRKHGLDRISIILSLAATVPYNYALMRGVLRRSDERFGGAIQSLGEAFDRWPRASCIAVLILANCIAFFEHYRGAAIFPWDFVGGYHAHAYGWYAQGGIFDPPRWFPWADGGFPAFFALQSGAWYVPLEFLKGLGITYDLVTAVRLQCLHVLFGAVGVLFLCRLFDLCWRAALIGALCFHFSAGFFCNQEHVDIIRGAAWAPWVLLVSNPRYLASSRWAVLIASLALFQFFVSAYPGIIVSVGYAAAIAWCLTMWHDKNAIFGLVTLKTILPGIAAVLMASLKFVPLVMYGDLGGDQALRMSPAHAEFIATLLMPYDVGLLKGDVTMRSLWLPAVALVGVVFLLRLSFLAMFGIALISASVFFMFKPFVSYLVLSLPGMQVSRFPVSDWRPILALGTVLLAASSIEPLLSPNVASNFDTKSLSKRLYGLGVLAAVACVISVWMGYSWAQVLAMLLSLGVVSAAFWMAVARAPLGSTVIHASILTSVLAVLAIANGMAYHLTQPRPWKMAWSERLEQKLFGRKVKFEDLSSPIAKSRRDARALYASTPAEALRTRKNSKYNLCWYEKSFCAFGYNNLKRSKPHLALAARIDDPTDGPSVLSFLSKPQQLVVLSEGENFDPKHVPDSAVDELVTNVPGVSAQMAGYEVDVVRYRIGTPVPIRMVENELWASGWQVQRCGDQSPCTENPAEHTSEYFRTWTVPPGNWTVELRYAPDLYRIPSILAALGLGLATLGTFLFALLDRHRSNVLETAEATSA